ncbi:hypothetical protein TNCV_3349051 [Trichonephila clavipes]|nr:hypothetical protein TNCV_3349051 [Trichonephila clavipes]
MRHFSIRPNSAYHVHLPLSSQLVSGYSTFQCYLGRQLFGGTYSHYCSLDSRHGYGALDNHTDMDFSTPQSPLFIRIERYRSAHHVRSFTTMKIYLRRLQIICSERGKDCLLLRQDKGHHESDTLYQLA